MRNPVMFVVGVGFGAHHGPVLQGLRRFVDDEPERVHGTRGPIPVVHGAVRQLRRGDRRGTREGASRHVAQDTRRDGRPRAARRRQRRRGSEPAARRQRRGRGERRRAHPERRRRDRGHRQRRRVGDHRRVGTRHPRVGRRPVGGHRRDARALRPDRRADHGPAGRDVPRPDDRTGRGIVSSEDAERDRAQHPAGRAHDHLPPGHCHASSRSRCSPTPSSPS